MHFEGPVLLKPGILPVDHRDMGELAGAVSLIVPTRNEAGNVSELLVRLGRLPAGVLGEVIFVDDSDDDTPAAIAYLAPSFDFQVAVVHREPGERLGGLSGAVIGASGSE